MAGLIKGWVDAANAYQMGVQARIVAEADRHINGQNKAKQEGVMNEIIQKNLFRSIIQMDKWRFGLEAWENKLNPDRYGYMRFIKKSN